MSAHFLLTAAARTISVVQVARMGEDEAFRYFCALRWHATDGEPVCPHCGCLAVYHYRARRLFKCKACLKQFSVTSGTIFHSRKLPIRDMLVAIAIFVNAAKGVSALQLGRDIDVSYKTAYVLAHKLREALGADQATGVAKGEVEIDGAYFGGYVKPANHKENRRDRRLAVNQSGKRRVVVIMRERGGRTYPFVVKAEDEAVGTIKVSVRCCFQSPTSGPCDGRTELDGHEAGPAAPHHGVAGRRIGGTGEVAAGPGDPGQVARERWRRRAVAWAAGH